LGKLKKLRILEKFEKLEIKDTRDIGKIEGIGKLCRE
jgi:hypothetical protein